MPKNSLPWLVLVPVVLILGLGLTLWAGIHTLTSEKQRWSESLQATADVAMQTLLGEQQEFYSRLESVEQLFLASERVEENEFALVAGYLTTEVPYIQGLAFVPRATALGQEKELWVYPPLPNLQQYLQGYLADARAYWQRKTGPHQGLNLQMMAAQNGLEEGKALPLPILAHIQGQSEAGVLLALVDVPAMMTQEIDGDDIAQKAALALVIDTVDAGGSKNLFAETLIQRDITGQTPWLVEKFSGGDSDMVQRLAFAHNYDQVWAGGNWQFTWSFDALSAGGGSFLTGGIIFGVGILATFIFAWVAWSQQNIAYAIQRQVVERTNELEHAGRRFRLITDNAYDLIAITGTGGTLDYINSAFHRVLGYNRDELRGQNFLTLVHPADVEMVKQAMREVIDGKSMTEYNLRMRHKRGDWTYMEAVTKALHTSDWAVSSLVTHCRDVTSRKQSADELARSEQRFRDLANSSADWLWEVDGDLKFTYVSPGVAGVLGCKPEEMVGTELNELFDADNAEAKDQIIQRIKRNQSYREVEFWTRSRQNERVCLRMSGVPVFNEQRAFSGYRGAATNVTAAKLDRDNMYKLATTDHLTSLLNRRRFMEELERSVSLARRHKTKGVLMFIDLDRFKEINDTHGHEAGDKILTGIADILKDSVRSTDIVARLGGDEFGIIMHNIPLNQAQDKMQKTVDRINQFSVEYNGANLNVTMSVGMIVYPQEDRASENLIMNADLAMYRAKDMGRNRMYVEEDTDEVTQDSVREQLKWVERLRVCLEEGDFEMYYQPIVSVKKRHRPLFEALLRIYDEDGKAGSPAIYIDAAEHFGLIQRLDLSVIERCLKTQAELQAEGVAMDVSINLSSRTLGDPEVMVTLRNLLAQYTHLDTSRIIFEVTETVALHDPAAMRDLGEIHAFITELRGMGFRFALDDFGSGFTSFSYLRVLKVDVVKIDGEFIKDLDSSVTDRLFVKSIAGLAQGLNIQTVAEFIENDGVLERVVKMGLDYAQGYHLGRPSDNIRQMVKDYTGKVVMDFHSKNADKIKDITLSGTEKKPVKKITQKALLKPGKETTKKIVKKVAQKSAKKITAKAKKAVKKA